ncbi:hypothetical protein MKW98_011795 [Papaver atlanticum]|uniref:nucleoside-diphosphate kinase n=1 Tax=Papaver atlanticum TaxID=357466 RepID=A0AAD4SLQ4_9MAGN|nr:hypothetical protein MKW98_011795 [Papaver atlanticum]
MRDSHRPVCKGSFHSRLRRGKQALLCLLVCKLYEIRSCKDCNRRGREVQEGKLWLNQRNQILLFSLSMVVLVKLKPSAEVFSAYMLQEQEPHAAEMERTFIAIKPDVVQRGLISEIVGFKLVAIKLVVPSKDFAQKHYHDRKERPLLKMDQKCNNSYFKS